MAYLDRTHDPRRRGIAIGGVVAIHALLGYVVLTGLAEHFAPNHRDRLTSFFDPLPPPPTPTPAPQPRQTQKTVTHVDKLIVPTPPVKLDDGADLLVPPRTNDLDPGNKLIALPPQPPVHVGITPKAATPRNSPASWALTDDYPARDLREENEGTTVFRVTVGTDGLVSGCSIVHSSGHPGLDAATCSAVKRRARFAPATDENGARVAGSYTNSVRWQIPG